MIIRRRHTANYTTIGNELFNDERLAADEVGILAYLLSRPDDWEIRRPALMRRWHIGRDALRRIIHNLMRTGWCQAERTRLSDGTFHTIYEIRDEPGPTLTDDEVKDALSLASSDAPETTSSTYVLADAGEPSPVNPTWSIESLPKTDSQNTESTKAGGVFWSDLQKAWPPDDVLSVLVCEKLFAALSRSDRKQAIEAAAPYIASGKVKNRKLCDLSTYLKERRFVGKTATATTEAPIIRPGTPQAARWLEYWKVTNPHRYAFWGGRFARGATVTAETEWPPALPTKDESTGPPESDLMSPEDREELAKQWG